MVDCNLDCFVYSNYSPGGPVIPMGPRIPGGPGVPGPLSSSGCGIVIDSPGGPGGPGGPGEPGFPCSPGNPPGPGPPGLPAGPCSQGIWVLVNQPSVFIILLFGCYPWSSLPSCSSGPNRAALARFSYLTSWSPVACACYCSETESIEIRYLDNLPRSPWSWLP